MKKLLCTLFLFAVIVSSLFAYTKPGGLPERVSIENLTTKEKVTFRRSELIYISINQFPMEGVFETPTITFSKGIYAKDKIQISMLDPDYCVCVYGWTVSYNSQTEMILEDGGNSGCASETIIHLIPEGLDSDNTNMDIYSYVTIPVSIGSSIENNVASTGLYPNAEYKYRFNFSGISNKPPYIVDRETGEVIIIIGPPIKIPTNSLVRKNTSQAMLYDNFGKIVKTVSLNSDRTHIYIGDLKHGIYILKVIIEGREYTEKITL